MEDADGLDKLEALQEHQDDDIYRRAVYLLENFANAETLPAAAAAGDRVKVRAKRKPVPSNHASEVTSTSLLHLQDALLHNIVTSLKKSDYLEGVGSLRETCHRGRAAVNGIIRYMKVRWQECYGCSLRPWNECMTTGTAALNIFHL